jgi:NAD-dependent dihydropyrimidine dehydrogenase PreA subunit
MPANRYESLDSGKPRPLINPDECKGCERCVNACPAHCLRISETLNCKGIRPAEYVGQGCTGCGICFYNCPEPYAIKIDNPDKVTQPTTV